MNVDLIIHGAAGVLVIGAAGASLVYGWRRGAFHDPACPDLALLRQAKRQGRLGISLREASELRARGHSVTDLLIDRGRD